MTIVVYLENLGVNSLKTNQCLAQCKRKDKNLQTNE